MKTVITIPKDARVFLIEDSEERIRWFSQRIPDLTVDTTAWAAIQTIASTKEPFDVVFLDHDLGIIEFGTGAHVARHLAATGFLGKNVVIHSINNSGAATMADILKGATIIPFGSFEIKHD